jgi:peptide/nickel transport system ATP-binding protein
LVLSRHRGTATASPATTTATSDAGPVATDSAAWATVARARAAGSTEGSGPALSTDGFGLRVPSPGGQLELVRDIHLELPKGRILGLVGESGSGKTTLVRAIAGFVPAHSSQVGTIRVAGATVAGPGAVDPATYRGKTVSIISQDPRQALNPSMRIGSQIAEAVRNATGISGSASAAQARELLEQVRISDPARRARQYPFELSGGMRQRVAIAIALACRPDLLLADEPTTALDVTTQLQIIRLLKELQTEIGMAVVLVSHDLALVDLISDVIAVMYAGTVVEHGPSAALLHAPRMRYTDALVKCSVTQPRRSGEGTLATIDGDPPGPANRLGGCAFSSRCDAAVAQCVVHEPDPTSYGPLAWARCWNPAGASPGGDPGRDDRRSEPGFDRVG